MERLYYLKNTKLQVRHRLPLGMRPALKHKTPNIGGHYLPPNTPVPVDIVELAHAREDIRTLWEAGALQVIKHNTGKPVDFGAMFAYLEGLAKDPTVLDEPSLGEPEPKQAVHVVWPASTELPEEAHDVEEEKHEDENEPAEEARSCGSECACDSESSGETGEDAKEDEKLDRSEDGPAPAAVQIKVQKGPTYSKTKLKGFKKDKLCAVAEGWSIDIIDMTKSQLVEAILKEQGES